MCCWCKKDNCHNQNAILTKCFETQRDLGHLDKKTAAVMAPIMDEELHSTANNMNIILFDINEISKFHKYQCMGWRKNMAAVTQWITNKGL